MRAFSWIAAGAFVLAFGAGCSNHSQPNFVYMPDMAYSPALKAQEEGMRPPPPGTIPVGFSGMPSDMTMEEAGVKYKNPLEPTELVLKRGRQQFNTYCVACHGPYGEGNGTVVPKFPMPPSLQSDKIRNYADGNIFYIITNGQNLMPSYKAQLKLKADRWAIVHYIRALQKAKKPTDQEVEQTKQAHVKGEKS